MRVSEGTRHRTGARGRMGAAPHPQAPARPDRRPEDPAMDAVTTPARRDQRADPFLRPGQRRSGRACSSALAELAGERPELTCTIGGDQRHGQRRDHRGRPAARAPPACSARSTAAPTTTRGPRWPRRRRLPRRGATCPTTTARRSSSRRPTCSAGPWRDTLNAATMLGQSKTCYQAEIDAACELIDFWRFNVGFGRRILAEQPISSAGVWNRLDHRPLEGVRVRRHAVQLHCDRRQPARPRRRSWATSSCGSPRTPSSWPPTTSCGCSRRRACLRA